MQPNQAFCVKPKIYLSQSQRGNWERWKNTNAVGDTGGRDRGHAGGRDPGGRDRGGHGNIIAAGADGTVGTDGILESQSTMGMA